MKTYLLLSAALLIPACFGQGVENRAPTGTRDDSRLTWIAPSGTYASRPGSPVTGQQFTMTDTKCDGTSTGPTTCRWSGTVWVATSASSTSGTPTNMAVGNANTIYLLGDSITDFCVPNNDGNLSYNGYCHFTYANWFLHQAFAVVDNGTTNGYGGLSGSCFSQTCNVHPALYLRVATDVIPLAPAYAMVMGGINDINQGVSSATIITAIKATQSGLNGANIKMILLTMLPSSGILSDSTRRTTWATVNQWMREWAKVTPNVILVDAAAAVIDPTSSTPVIASNWSSDGTHPTAAGAMRIGLAIANALYPVIVPPGIGPAWNSDPLNLVTNALMVGTSGTLAGGATGQVATGWTLTNSGGGTCVGSKVARTDGKPGSMQIITMTGTAQTDHCDLMMDVSGWGTSDLLHLIAEIGAGAIVQNQVLITMIYHASGFDITVTAGGENQHFASDRSWNITLPSYVGRTIERPLFGGVTSVTVGVQVYGTYGTVPVGVVECAKKVTI